jgi:hypothetical protein
LLVVFYVSEVFFFYSGWTLKIKTGKTLMKYHEIIQLRLFITIIT